MKFVVSSGQDRTTLDQGVPFQIRFPVAEGLWISASLGNINKGDFVFCHIKGAGFVGVGVCVGSAVPGTDFLVEDNGVQKNIMDCSWVNPMAKAAINASKEMFLQVNWIRTTKRDLGYWEKGMTSVPLVAYVPTDGTTHDMVLKHFNITLT